MSLSFMLPIDVQLVTHYVQKAVEHYKTKIKDGDASLTMLSDELLHAKLEAILMTHCHNKLCLFTVFDLMPAKFFAELGLDLKNKKTYRKHNYSPAVYEALDEWMHSCITAQGASRL
jgi:hypothetical protein